MSDPWADDDLPLMGDDDEDLPPWAVVMLLAAAVAVLLAIGLAAYLALRWRA